MTDNQVIVRVREVYGVERIYPVNETAQRLADLTRKKTLDRVDLRDIKALGFNVTSEAVAL